MTSLTDMRFCLASLHALVGIILSVAGTNRVASFTFEFQRIVKENNRDLSQRTTGFLTRLSVTNGKSCASQASIPPSSGRTLVMPLARSSSATRALVASLGHEQ